MSHPAWFLVGIGAILVLAGFVWLLGGSVPWLGRLPGDIVIERENFRFYFPVVTCLLISGLLTAILWLFRALGR